MTLARTALRLAVVQAIKGVTGSRPTIADGRVYDSRISPEDPEDFSEDARALVVVLTDGDEGDALSEQNGGPPFHRQIELVFDIGMVCREKADNDADGYLIGYPDTDARLEASLDMLQTQIVRYLTASRDPLALFFQNFVRAWKQESHRQVEDAASVKLARRLWTLTCEVNDDIYETPVPGAAPPTGLNILPEPLRTVAALMPAGSAGADTSAAIAAALGVTPFASDAFKGVDITVDAGDPTANPIVADDQVKASADTGQ